MEETESHTKNTTKRSADNDINLTHVHTKNLNGYVNLTTLEVFRTNTALHNDINMRVEGNDILDNRSKRGLLSEIEATTKEEASGTESTTVMDVFNGTSGALTDIPSTEKVIVVTPLKGTGGTDLDNEEIQIITAEEGTDSVFTATSDSIFTTSTETGFASVTINADEVQTTSKTEELVAESSDIHEVTTENSEGNENIEREAIGYSFTETTDHVLLIVTSDEVSDEELENGATNIIKILTESLNGVPTESPKDSASFSDIEHKKATTEDTNRGSDSDFLGGATISQKTNDDLITPSHENPNHGNYEESTSSMEQMEKFTTDGNEEMTTEVNSTPRVFYIEELTHEIDNLTTTNNYFTKETTEQISLVDLEETRKNDSADAVEVVEIVTEISVIRTVNGKRVEEKLSSPGTKKVKKSTKVEEELLEDEEDIEDLDSFLKTDDDLLNSISGDDRQFSLDDPIDDLSTIFKDDGVEDETTINPTNDESNIDETTTTAANENFITISVDFALSISTITPVNSSSDLEEITKSLLQETPATLGPQIIVEATVKLQKTSENDGLKLKLPLPDSSEESEITQEESKRVDVITEDYEINLDTINKFLHNVINTTDETETLDYEMEDPQISGNISGQNVKFSVKISTKETNFFIPPDAHVFNNEDAINITWKSSNSNMNNSLWLGHVGKSAQLNIVQGNQMHVHKTSPIPQTTDMLRNGDIALEGDIQIHLSNPGIFNRTELKPGSHQPSAHNIINTVAAEILGGCVGLTMIVGIMVYYSFRRFRGKAHSFKPNSEA